MTNDGLEARFTQEDINKATYWVDAANNLFNGKHEFDPRWIREVIENLEPYAVPGNAAYMYVNILNRQLSSRIQQPVASDSAYDL